jgi:hypothetical protein
VPPNRRTGTRRRFRTGRPHGAHRDSSFPTPDEHDAEHQADTEAGSAPAHQSTALITKLTTIPVPRNVAVAARDAGESIALPLNPLPEVQPRRVGAEPGSARERRARSERSQSEPSRVGSQLAGRTHGSWGRPRPGRRWCPRSTPIANQPRQSNVACPARTRPMTSE